MNVSLAISIKLPTQPQNAEMDMGGLKKPREHIRHWEMAKSRRDYNRLLSNIIEEANKADFEVKIVGHLVYGDKGYAFPILKSISKKARHTAVIVAGQHGDEDWAIDCLVQSLSGLDKTLWNIYIIPVSNPWGWAHISRLNGERKGSNWKVGERETKELELIFDAVPKKVSLFLDCHGDVDCSGAYIYERKVPGVSSLARLVLDDISSYFEIYSPRKVYGDPCRRGVVTSGKEATLEEYFYEHRGATFSLTIEVPGRIIGTGVNRLAGGSRMIISALNNFERAAGIGVKVEPEKKVEEKVEPQIQPIKEESK